MTLTANPRVHVDECLDPEASRPEIVYPDSDGKPMAENTLQFRWIVTIKEGLDASSATSPTSSSPGTRSGIRWRGSPRSAPAPDAMVAFGRPKGDRGSYKQWEEEGIAPQVVFEVLSPGNRFREMIGKLEFYEKYGVEEYYIYDPDDVVLEGWTAAGDGLAGDPPTWTAGPARRLGIRFDPPAES